MMSDVTTILALDERSIGTLVFLVIMFISWIMNLGKDNKQKQGQANRQAGPRPPGQRDGRIQSEIDKFLEEVSGGKSEPTPAQRQREQHERRDRERRKREKRREEVRRQEQKARRERKSREQVHREQVQGRRSAAKVEAPPELKPAASERRLGSGVTDHVATYMEEDRVDRHVEQHLDNQVAASVQQHITSSVRQHLGAGKPLNETGSDGTENARAIVNLLRDPGGVRQAIILNEVLSRPRALRK